MYNLTLKNNHVIIMQTFTFIQEKLRERQAEGILEDVSECFDKSSPFDGLETHYFQRKYYKENFNLLVRPVYINDSYHHVSSILCPSLPLLTY